MRKTGLIAGFLVFSTAAFAVDTTLLNMVMPDAKVMAGLNVANAKNSPLGQYILMHLAANGGNGLDSFSAQTGFDPRQDVTEILAASAGNQQQGLLLARGTFNVEKLVAAATKDSTTAVQQYGGATLIVSTAGTASHSVAFIGTSIAVVGDTASVKAAIDRNPKPNSIDPKLAVRVQQLSTTEDAWSVALASISALVPQIGSTNLEGPGKQVFQLVKDIQESSGGVKFGATVEITGEAVTSDPKNATALGDLVKMFGSLAMLAGGKDPNVAAAAKILQDLHVITDGTTVNIALSIPEDQLEALLKPMAQAHKL